MEFWHIILVATIIGIVILGLILAILFCCSNERNVTSKVLKIDMLDMMLKVKKKTTKIKEFSS